MTGWSWDKEDAKSHVIVPKSEAVAVYLNNSDQLIIRQQGELGEEDSMVIIPVGYTETLINAIRSAKKL